MPVVSQPDSLGVAPSSGRTPFTLTETNGTSKGLIINTQGSTAINALEIDAPHTLFTIDGDGSALLQSDDRLGVTFGGTGNTGAGLSVQNTPTAFAVGLTASSTEAIAEADDSGAVRRASISSLTGVLVAVHAAPADGTLAAGECCLWFDQTNGAAKLMVKGKSANGTVVSAAIALS